MNLTLVTKGQIAYISIATENINYPQFPQLEQLGELFQMRIQFDLSASYR